MRKHQLLSFLFASLLMLSLTSCDKDDDEQQQPAQSNTEMLTDGEWTGDKIYSEGSDVTADAKLFGFDVTKAKFNFTESGFYTLKLEGATLRTGSWEFSTDEKSIVLDKGTDDVTVFAVNKLSSSEFWAEGDLPLDEDGIMSFEGEIRMKR